MERAWGKGGAISQAPLIARYQAVASAFGDARRAALRSAGSPCTMPPKRMLAHGFKQVMTADPGRTFCA
jgi:hypothetical protein